MSEFLQPVPRSVLFELLQYKIAEVQDGTIEHLPERFCVISYLYDMQSRKGVKRQSDYASIWGWSRSWISRHIGEIEAEARRQASFYAGASGGRASPGGAYGDGAAYRASALPTPTPKQVSNSPATPQQQPCNNPATENDDSSASSGKPAISSNAPATVQQQSSNTYSSEPSDKQRTDISSSASCAREADFSFLSEKDEVYRPGIEAAASQVTDLSDPYRLSKLASRRWGRRNGPKPADLKHLLKRHGPEVVTAGLVIAGDTDSPNMGYLTSILKRLTHQQQNPHASTDRSRPGGPLKRSAPDRRGQRDGRKSPASDLEHNLRLADAALGPGD